MLRWFWPEPPPRDRAEKAGDDGMKGPTLLQHLGEMRRGVSAGEGGYPLRYAARLLRVAVALDCAAQQIDLLVAAGIDGQVHIPALNLCPFVPSLPRQPVGVLLESLMEDAHDHQSVVAARGNLGELLKEVDVGAVVGGRLQELSHLVDEDDEAAAGAWVLGGNPTQGVDDLLFAPSRRERICDEPGCFNGLAHHLGRTFPAADDGQDAPSPSHAAAKRPR